MEASGHPPIRSTPPQLKSVLPRPSDASAAAADSGAIVPRAATKPASGVKRKRQGNHVIQEGGGVAAASSVAAPTTMLAAGPRKQAATGGRPKSMPAGPSRRKKVQARGRAPPRPPTPTPAPASGTDSDGDASYMFVDTPVSSDLHMVPTSYVNLLEDNAVKIGSKLLDDFEQSFDEFEGAEGDEELEPELEEIEEETFEATAPKNKAYQTANYTETEDLHLLRDWEKISLDAVAGNDQTGKKYWQRIEDRFYRDMPTPSTRMLRSLQGRYDAIKQCYSWWSACLEQVRNAPPSGCIIDDYDRIAQERYKDMPASKGKPFTLHHCWKVLETSEKWKLRDQEAAPKKGAFVTLEDDPKDSEEDKKGGRNKDKPDGRRMAKDTKKKLGEATSLKEQIYKWMKSKESVMAKHMDSKNGHSREETRTERSKVGGYPASRRAETCCQGDEGQGPS